MTAMRVGLHRASMPRLVTSYPSSSAKHTCHGASPGKSASRLHRACLDGREQTEKYTIIHSAAALVVCVLVARGLRGLAGMAARLPRSLYLDRAYSSGSAAARRRCRPSLGLQGGTRARLFTEQLGVLGCGLPSLLRDTLSAASPLDNGSAG